LIRDESVAREIFDQALNYVAERKGAVRQYWDTHQEITDAFYKGGCTLGQAWQSTTQTMNKETKGEIAFLAPREGAIAWLDTAVIPKAAHHPDAAYDFINFCLTPENAALFSQYSWFNSASANWWSTADSTVREFMEFAYGRGAALDRHWWWSPKPGSFYTLQKEYADKIY
jgi:spermidine/putrescine transport system substrate-binding protein